MTKPAPPGFVDHMPPLGHWQCNPAPTALLSRSSGVVIVTPTRTSWPAKQIEVAQHQPAFGEHVQRKAAFQKQFAAATGEPVLLFDGLPAVAGAAHKHFARRGAVAIAG